jgi:hypothetical protein
MKELWSLVGASLIPLIAYGLKELVVPKLSSAKQEVTVTDEEGKSETLTVEFGSSDEQIRKRVDEAYAFEKQISESLEKIVRETNMALHSARNQKIDFILAAPGYKIGIEVKSNIERLNENAIKNYLRSDGGIENLLIISRKAPSEHFQRRFSEMVKRIDAGKRISLLTVSEDLDATKMIKNALSRMLWDDGQRNRLPNSP